MTTSGQSACAAAMAAKSICWHWLTGGGAAVGGGVVSWFSAPSRGVAEPGGGGGGGGRTTGDSVFAGEAQEGGRDKASATTFADLGVCLKSALNYARNDICLCLLSCRPRR